MEIFLWILGCIATFIGLILIAVLYMLSVAFKAYIQTEDGAKSISPKKKR